jgi:hypothetical protein
MQKWEYCYIYNLNLCFAAPEEVKKTNYGKILGRMQGYPLDTMAPVMAELGLEGWELVSVDGSVFVFKRPILE